jgi:gluconate 5-dehydrogenase
VSEPDLFSLRGRSVLVVGAGGDLGRRAALVSGRWGAHVSVADHPSAQANLDETVAILRDEGCAVSPLSCDVTSEASVHACVTSVARDHGLDVLINAAGVMLRKAVAETTLEEWQRVLDVNLTGTWLLNRAAGRVMTAAAHGKIINFATVYAERVGPVPESAYYASKAGVANLTRSMASEFGSHGVQVNCLALGVFYPTNMTAALKDAPDTLRWMEERTLLKRLGDPARDLDGIISLLASNGSDYITGQVLYVDGGWSAW